MTINIISSQEMQRIERASLGLGVTVENLMHEAAEGAVAEFLKEFSDHTAGLIVLLVGKGNNGGDALAMGSLLLQRGFQVAAALVYPTTQLSPVCLREFHRFQQLGGYECGRAVSPSCIIDGIVGTGFHGPIDSPMREMIVWANQQSCPIFAIDIPSGLEGTTGEIWGVAIRASMTCMLGFPKIGCFIGQGWDHVGKLSFVSLSYPAQAVGAMRIEARVLVPESLQLPPVQRTRHKYLRGYVVAVAGSSCMPGAAALATMAALRSGAGIVRLMTLTDRPHEEIPPEVIADRFTSDSFRCEMARANSVLLGPGLGRSPQAEGVCSEVLGSLKCSVVIDGDGLYYLSRHGAWSLPPGSIVTPHHGEMALLLHEVPTLHRCQAWADLHRVTLVYKGAPTFIFHPGTIPYVVTAGTPAMATAGSGDVLAGMVAALLAQNMPSDEAALLGTHLHGRAGEIAASLMTPHNVIATDIIQAIPQAFRSQERQR